MFKSLITVAAIAGGTSLALAGGDRCGGATASTIEASYRAPMNIVQTAAEAGSFSTLLAAAKAAGLVEALSGPGPLTVFAPTDEAFKRLPAGTLETLLQPGNKEMLAGILKYHVVPGKVLAAQVVTVDGAATLNGQRVDIAATGGTVTVDGAKVVKTDIECSNGVIHVIDRVIMPETANIVQVADKAGSFGTLIAAAKAAGIAEVLMGPGPFTIFAPTDNAFAALPAGTVESLLKPENKEKLASILKFHVVQGRVYGADAVKAGTAKTLQGQSVTIKAQAGTVTVNGAKVVSKDIDASNGVIHVIDQVILPTAK